MKAVKDMGPTSKTTIAHQMCDMERKHIEILTCDKCGKLKRFVESI